MQVTKEWVEELARKYGRRPKEVRDVLWPKTPSKSLSYLNKVQSLGIEMTIKIADVLGCSLDEVVRRPYNTTMFVNEGFCREEDELTNGEPLHRIIASQKQIIDRQDNEIKRIEKLTHDQLDMKDKQILELGSRIDKLIEVVQNHDNQ